MDPNELRKIVKESVVEAMHSCLDAQVRALHRLAPHEPQKEKEEAPGEGLSQVDMARDILKQAKTPLHINDILERIETRYGVRIDRESLVSSLTKKVKQGGRFRRPEPNTFELAEAPAADASQ